MYSAAIIIATICLLLISIILLRASYYLINNACSKFQKTLLSEEYKSLKSGDIILFAPILHNFTNSLLTMNLFSHIGMIVNDPELGICISETNGSNRIKKSGGAEIFPFLARLKNYEGCFYLMRLNMQLDEKREEILLKSVKEIIDWPYPSFKTKLLSLIGCVDNTRHCFQHTGWLLKQIGLLPPEIELGFTSSGDISSIYKFELPDGYKYHFPVQLVHNF